MRGLGVECETRPSATRGWDAVSSTGGCPCGSGVAIPESSPAQQRPHQATWPKLPCHCSAVMGHRWLEGITGARRTQGQAVEPRGQGQAGERQVPRLPCQCHHGLSGHPLDSQHRGRRAGGSWTWFCVISARVDLPVWPGKALSCAWPCPSCRTQRGPLCSSGWLVSLVRAKGRHLTGQYVTVWV